MDRELGGIHVEEVYKLTELQKSLVRVLSNYVRLFATVILGILLVRVLLEVLGEDITGLIDLIGSTIGLAAVLEEVVSWSMIRELGVAHHSTNEETFRRVYSSAIIVSAGASATTFVLYWVIYAILPFMQVPQDLLYAAKWFVIAKGVESVAIVFLAPFFNMYLVTERQIHYNFWLVAKRASSILAAVIFFWTGPLEPTSKLIWFGWISCFLHISIVVVSVSILFRLDKKMIPSMRLATRVHVKTILSTSGWNIAVLGSLWMGLPASQIIMNLHFGVIGNLIFGRAIQLGGYARMLTNGLSHGLDAVSVRISSQSEGDKKIKSVLHHSTRLIGFVAFPSVLGIAVLTEPIIRLWVENKLPLLVADMVVLTRILLIGFLVMSLSDNWTKILYGAGHIRRYAPIAVMGGVLNVVLAFCLINLFPDSIGYSAPAWAFSMVYLTCYLGFMSIMVKKTLDINLRNVFSPLLPPLIAATTCAPVLLIFLFNVAQWSLFWLVKAVASYGLCYLVLCWIILPSSEERAHVYRAFRQWRCLKGHNVG